MLAHDVRESTGTSSPRESGKATRRAVDMRTASLTPRSRRAVDVIERLAALTLGDIARTTNGVGAIRRLRILPRAVVARAGENHGCARALGDRDAIIRSAGLHAAEALRRHQDSYPYFRARRSADAIRYAKDASKTRSRWW